MWWSICGWILIRGVFPPTVKKNMNTSPVWAYGIAFYLKEIANAKYNSIRFWVSWNKIDTGRYDMSENHEINSTFIPIRLVHVYLID